MACRVPMAPPKLFTQADLDAAVAKAVADEREAIARLLQNYVDAWAEAAHGSPLLAEKVSVIQSHLAVIRARGGK